MEGGGRSKRVTLICKEYYSKRAQYISRFENPQRPFVKLLHSSIIVLGFI